MLSFQIELGFYIIVHILSFFPSRSWMLLCRLEFGRFDSRTWAVLLSGLLELPRSRFWDSELAQRDGVKAGGVDH